MNEEGVFVDFRIAASYRIPMPVLSVRRYSGRDGAYTYPICVPAATRPYRVNTYPFATAADNV